MAPLRQILQQMRDSISATVASLAADYIQDGEYVWKTLTSNWRERFLLPVHRNPTAVDIAERMRVHVAIAELSSTLFTTEQELVGLKTTLAHAHPLLTVLGASYIDCAIGNERTGFFPGVPLARKMVTRSKAVEAAAVWEIKQLRSPYIDNLVRQWVDILQAHVGLATTVARVRGDVRTYKVRSEVNPLIALLFEVKPLVQQDPRRLPQLAEIRQMLRNSVANNQDYQAYLRGMCQGYGDEDEFHVIMDLFYTEQLPLPS